MQGRGRWVSNQIPQHGRTLPVKRHGKRFRRNVILREAVQVISASVRGAAWGPPTSPEAPGCGVQAGTQDDSRVSVRRRRDLADRLGYANQRR